MLGTRSRLFIAGLFVAGSISCLSLMPSAKAVELSAGTAAINTATSSAVELQLWVDLLESTPEYFEVDEAAAKEMIGELRLALRTGDFADATDDQRQLGELLERALRMVDNDELARAHFATSLRPVFAKIGVEAQEIADKITSGELTAEHLPAIAASVRRLEEKKKASLDIRQLVWDTKRLGAEASKLGLDEFEERWKRLHLESRKFILKPNLLTNYSLQAFTQRHNALYNHFRTVMMNAFEQRIHRSRAHGLQDLSQHFIQLRDSYSRYLESDVESYDWRLFNGAVESLDAYEASPTAQDNPGSHREQLLTDRDVVKIKREYETVAPVEAQRPAAAEGKRVKREPVAVAPLGS